MPQRTYEPPDQQINVFSSCDERIIERMGELSHVNPQLDNDVHQLFELAKDQLVKEQRTRKRNRR